MNECASAPTVGRLHRSLWVKLLPAFALAALAVALVPGSHGGSEPPVGTLLATGSLVTIFTAGALYLAIRSDLGLPARVALYAVAWNALIVLVKFVLAPHGLYRVNRAVDFESLLALDDPFEAALTMLPVLALYVLGYLVVYRIARVRIRRLPVAHGRRLVLPLVGASYALAGAATALVLVYGLARGAHAEYLEFVFSSGVSLAIAVALAGAGGLAALAFRDVADRAAVVGDAALLVQFFWLGLYFLALYHALWVVYVLVLTSIWPLRTVVPK